METLLKKATDRYVLPDYHGIEIKTKTETSHYPIGLFSCAFDNRPLEMKRLLNTCGWPDKRDPKYKVFYLTANGLSYSFTRRHSFLLSANYEKQRLDFIIKNRWTGEDVTSMSWTYSELESRLTHKLSYLVIVTVKKDEVDGTTYFKYCNPIFYKLRCFRDFIELIEEGIITVSFNIAYYRTPERYGDYKDMGTTFEIGKENIDRLFVKI